MSESIFDVFNIYRLMSEANALFHFKHNKSLWNIHDCRIFHNFFIKVENEIDYIYSISYLALILNKNEYLSPDAAEILKSHYPSVDNKFRILRDLRTIFPIHNKTAEIKRGIPAQKKIGIKTFVKKRRFKLAWKSIFQYFTKILKELISVLQTHTTSNLPERSFLKLFFKKNNFTKHKKHICIKENTLGIGDVLSIDGKNAILYLHDFIQLPQLKSTTYLFNAFAQNAPGCIRSFIGIISKIYPGKVYMIYNNFFHTSLVDYKFASGKLYLLATSWGEHGGSSTYLYIIVFKNKAVYQSQRFLIYHDLFNFYHVEPHELTHGVTLISEITEKNVITETYSFSFDSYEEPINQINLKEKTEKKRNKLSFKKIPTKYI